jgi:hypothetical protein
LTKQVVRHYNSFFSGCQLGAIERTITVLFLTTTAHPINFDLCKLI